MNHKALALVLPIALAALLLVACSSDDDPSPTATPATGSAQPTATGGAASPEATASASPEVPSPEASTATPAASATPEIECPVDAAVCALAETLEAHLEDGEHDAIVDLMMTDEYPCPEGQPDGPGGPFPLCEDAPGGEVRSGYQLARRYSHGTIVDREAMLGFYDVFLPAMDPNAIDAHGDGKLRLVGVSCAQAPGGTCDLGTVIFTGIPRGETRELLIFWIPLPAGEATPILMVWTGIILPDEEPILFETGGNLFDLGEIHLLE